MSRLVLGTRNKVVNRSNKALSSWRSITEERENKLTKERISKERKCIKVTTKLTEIENKKLVILLEMMNEENHTMKGIYA